MKKLIPIALMAALSSNTCTQQEESNLQNEERPRISVGPCLAQSNHVRNLIDSHRELIFLQETCFQINELCQTNRPLEEEVCNENQEHHCLAVKEIVDKKEETIMGAINIYENNCTQPEHPVLELDTLLAESEIYNNISQFENCRDLSIRSSQAIRRAQQIDASPILQICESMLASCAANPSSAHCSVERSTECTDQLLSNIINRQTVIEEFNALNRAIQEECPIPAFDSEYQIDR